MMLNILSLGAGVQSTTMALMAAHGEITPMPDCAIFADTGAEPRAVYDHLEWLMSGNVLPYPVHVVTAGNLRDDILARADGSDRRLAAVPFFTKNDDGSQGRLPRQCTKEYKLVPIKRKTRELLAAAETKRAVTWIGISGDEAGRFRDSNVRYIENRHPLLSKVTEKRHRPFSPAHPDGLWMTRADCLTWLDRNGYPRPPKSACTFCPYHDGALWQDMKANDPDSWAEAVAVDEVVRRGGFAGIKNPIFVHRSMTPLADALLTKATNDDQPDMLGECEGMCGV